MRDITPEIVRMADEIGGWLAASGFVGGISPAQGKVLALDALRTGTPLMDMISSISIIHGRIAKRSEAMHAAFRMMGGGLLWLETGERGVAKVRVWRSPDKNDAVEVSFTLEEAARRGLCGSGGAMLPGQKGLTGWQRFPAEMLRARVIAKAMRMIAPEASSGMIVPEEADEADILDAARSENGGPAAKAAAAVANAVAAAREAGRQEPDPTAATAPVTAPVTATATANANANANAIQSAALQQPDQQPTQAPAPHAAGAAARNEPASVTAAAAPAPSASELRQQLRRRIRNILNRRADAYADIAKLIEIHGGGKTVLSVPEKNLAAFEADLKILEEEEEKKP